jgi:excisionase family DNA binding protein
VQDTIVPPDAAFPHHGEAETAATGRLLSREEVAERLHVSSDTVRRLVRGGHLEEILVSPQSPRITPESVDRHLERNRVSAA